LYDLLITNGRVLDGTGSPWYRADVAVAGDTIVAIGRLAGREAARVIDATGHFVTPGFIEEHGHSDVTYLVDPHSQSAVRQGMTTLVVGNCGMSAAPVSNEMLQTYLRGAPLFSFDGYDWTWEGMGQYLEAVAAARPSVNVTALAGHMPVRAIVLGEANRPATKDERADMRAVLDRALSEGACGFSTGLTYQHTVFADTDEIAETARALKAHGRSYHTHMRSYGKGLLGALKESIEVARRAEVPLVVSHMYPAGRDYWGKSADCLEMLERARDEGLEVGYDITPWLRGGGPIMQMFPLWAREGGIDATIERLKNADVRSGVTAEIEGKGPYSIGSPWDDQLICHVGDPEHRDWLGRSIAEIAAERGEPPAEAALLMLVEDKGNYWVAPTNKCDEDVDRLIKHPMGVPVADGYALAPEGPLAYQDRPNSYGTFPRVLGRYVRERGVLTWEEAVQKMTAIPAARVGLWDRGVLREGLAADVVVFDPETVIEKADYSHPQEYPEGIDWVVVNGQVTVSPDGHTGARAGKVF
jgi:N-acyl-D-amino-acid deacylase